MSRGNDWRLFCIHKITYRNLGDIRVWANGEGAIGRTGLLSFACFSYLRSVCVCVAADVSVVAPLAICLAVQITSSSLALCRIPILVRFPVSSSSPSASRCHPRLSRPRPSLATSPTLLSPFLRRSSLKLLRRFAVHRLKADKTLVVRLSLLSPHRSRSLELTFLSNCSAFCLPPRTLQFSSAYSAITTFSL